MSPILRITLLYSLVPVVFTIIGATVGAYWPLFGRLRGHVLHLAGGVVFSVVAVELLPEIQHRAVEGGAPVRDVALGFALGIGTMLAVDRLLDRIRDDDGDDDDDANLPAPTRVAGVPLADPESRMPEAVRGDARRIPRREPVALRAARPSPARRRAVYWGQWQDARAGSHT